MLGLVAPKIHFDFERIHQSFFTTKTSIGDNSNDQRTRRNHLQQQRQQPEYKYNSFNLYLLFLCLPDIALNTYLITVYSRFATQSLDTDYRTMVLWPAARFSGQKIQAKAWNDAFLLGCTAANQYLNVVITYEVFTLLKKSRQGIRSPPPSPSKACLQAFASYAFAAIPATLRIILDRFAGEDSRKKRRAGRILGSFFFLLSTGLPTIYICYVCVVIWKRKLLPSIGGRLRSLALYFFRILLTFFLVWFPGTVLTNIGHSPKYSKLYSLGLLLFAIQPVLCTTMALTKDDVRISVMNLLTFSYCRRTTHHENNDEAEAVED